MHKTASLTVSNFLTANMAAIIGTNYYYGDGYITNVVKAINTITPDGTLHENKMDALCPTVPSKHTQKKTEAPPSNCLR